MLVSRVTDRARNRGKATVVLLGTLDTKGVEYAYLRDRVSDVGVEVIVVDAGILGQPPFLPDVRREEVADAAGADLGALAERRDRGMAIEAMCRGAAIIAERLHSEGRLDGIAGVGGTGGSAILAAAMARLPVGVPKLLVSTVASGDTRAYVGASDVTMMYSVADFSGINRISSAILANSAAAIAAMVNAAPPSLPEATGVIGASMWGITTPCVTEARERLEELGYEVLVFHQTGIGGRSMERLMEEGVVTASLDATLAELAGEVVGGIWPATATRLEVAGRLGIPQVVAPGAVDFVAMGPREDVPERFAGRLFYDHSPVMTGIRTSPKECLELGRRIARKLNGARGPTTLFLPLRGVSFVSTAGQPFHDPSADEALFGGLRTDLDRDRVDLVELDTHINDPEFAKAMAMRLHEQHEAWKRA